MSTFSPLNLVESASKKDLEEEHTRELEIETAFKLYQEAIELHQQNRLCEAYLVYRTLAHSNVIVNHYYEEVDFVRGFQNGSANVQPDELSFIPQNVKSVRYLYFRNKGFLHLSILKAGPTTMQQVYDADYQSAPDQTRLSLFDFTKDMFYSMVDGFVNCLIYQEADDVLLHVLHDIFVYLDVKRLARFTLEYSQSAPTECDDLDSILPAHTWVGKVWDTFKKHGFADETQTAEISKKLHFLKPIKRDWQEQVSKKLSRNALHVKVKADANWLDVIMAYNAAIKESLDKERIPDYAKIPSKYVNPYLASENSWDTVQFLFMDNEDTQEDDAQIAPEVIVEAIAEELPQAAEEDTPVEVIPIDLDPPQASFAAEKGMMRLSKRLNKGELAPINADDIYLTRHYFVETETYFTHLNESIAQIFQTDSPIVADIVKHIVATEGNEVEPLYISEFLRCLNHWKPRSYNRILFPEEKSDADSKSQSDKKKLIEVLTSFGNQSSEKDTEVEDLDSAESGEFIKTLLLSKKEFTGHVDRSRLAMIKHLFTSLIEKKWLTLLLRAVHDWAMQLEDLFWNEFKSADSHSDEEITFAVGLYEVLVNSFIQIQNQIATTLDQRGWNSTLKANKSFNVNNVELLRIDDRITKWARVLDLDLDEKRARQNEASLHSLTRFYWSTNYYIAAKSHTWKEKKYVVLHLNKLRELLRSLGAEDFLLPYPNYTEIGKFSFETLHRRLSTASILSIFSKILNQTDSKESASNETISLLESILIEEVNLAGPDDGLNGIPHINQKESSLVTSVLHGHAQLDRWSLISVKQFFGECPVELKLSLWNILFLFYQKDSVSKYQTGVEQNLKFVLLFLESSQFKADKENKQVHLLKVLSSFKNYLSVFIEQISHQKWQLPNAASNSDIIAHFSRIFELCYCFSLHEEAALITGNRVSLMSNSEAAFQYFKDFLIESVTIMVIYCASKTDLSEQQEQRLLELMSLIHHQLGLRQLCDSSNGLFLRFEEDILVCMQKLPEKELNQVMACRFHYKVKFNGQFPMDHATIKTAELDKRSAEELAEFIVPLSFKSNPLIHNTRNDIKQVIEDLFNIIEEPDIDADKALVENEATLEKFLDRSVLNARFIKEAFYGLKSLEFMAPAKPNKIADIGLYFLEATIMLNSYKIRKKSAQSRTVELDKIISLLKQDLIHGSDRAESWILYGQAYGFLVEDDLIWTSDKLNIIDRKVVTANIQRKSLVCYMMAISTLTRQGRLCMEDSKPLIGYLMNTFSKEMYSAVKSPMDMIAFKVQNGARFIRRNNLQMLLNVAEKPSVSRKFCLSILYKCLQIATKANPEEWSSFYYLGKVMANIKLPPLQILEVMAQACTLAKGSSVAGDPILEPAYKFYSLLYKFVKQKLLSPDLGLEYLSKEPYLRLQHELGEPSLESFFKGTFQCLQKLTSIDKKGWYHKPTFRLAMIAYHDFSDLKEAQSLILKYFLLKSSNKTFLQLWKPEHERPGKHFVYMYQYTQFYITMLKHENDLTALTLLFPKLRRANSTMLLLYFAWELICSSYCNIVRTIFRIEFGLAERFLLFTQHATFMAQARRIIDSMDANSLPDNVQSRLCLLHILAEMRKLNNGYGPTSLIDDTFCAVFIQIYQSYSSKFPEDPAQAITTSPLAKVKKLAKRDLMPFANEMMTKLKRDTDTYLKDHPNILNSYVVEFEEEEKRLEIEREAARVRWMEILGFVTQRALVEPVILQTLQKSMRQMILTTVPQTGGFSADAYIRHRQRILVARATSLAQMTSSTNHPNYSMHGYSPQSGYSYSQFPQYQTQMAQYANNSSALAAYYSSLLGYTGSSSTNQVQGLAHSASAQYYGSMPYSDAYKNGIPYYTTPQTIENPVANNSSDIVVISDESRGSSPKLNAKDGNGATVSAAAELTSIPQPSDERNTEPINEGKRDLGVEVMEEHISKKPRTDEAISVEPEAPTSV